MIYCLENHPRNKYFVKLGEIMKFANLPITAQDALIHYMSIDGAEWAVEKNWEDWKWGEGKPNTPEMRLEALKDIDKFRSRFIQEFGEELFGYMEYPTKMLLGIIKLDRYYCQETFEKCIVRKNVEYDIPTWPVILSPLPEETLQDGWHRFHEYVRLNIETIPIVWFND